MFDRLAGKNYVVAGCKPWSRDIFESIISGYPGEWHFMPDKSDLNYTDIKNINPRYIFFLHWSWLVPDKIVNNFECICFHMADLPYGRGGSPLQNLIMRGYTQTMLTAFRMVHEIDAGPIYMKELLSLDGSAGDIYRRASEISAFMIKKIINNELIPIDQKGKVVKFKRRCSAESFVPEVKATADLYDFIRMLDAEGYPKAYLIQNGFRYELSNARLVNGGIFADVIISPSSK